jgi:hypothetical protein
MFLTKLTEFLPNLRNDDEGNGIARTRAFPSATWERGKGAEHFMLVFRRAFICLLLASMLGAIAYICLMRSSPANDAPVAILVWFSALIGVLVWCTVYLKVEPTLTRTALIVTTLTLLPMAIFAISQALM